MTKWRILLVLATAKFLVVLDSTVMNVSISVLVVDLHTEVTKIQAAITMSSLTAAAFMITGGKLGDLWGRRRAFAIGLVVYGAGSAITAAAPNVWALIFGWSIVKGLGVALMMSALVAPMAGNYAGKDRALAYAFLGGRSHRRAGPVVNTEASLVPYRRGGDSWFGERPWRA